MADLLFAGLRPDVLRHGDDLMSFSMLDALSRAKLAFDDGDFKTAASTLQLAADYCDKMHALQEEMALLDAELTDRINKDKTA